MRTTIEIDDKLMKDVLRATGATTKKQAVELGLRTMLALRAQEKVRKLRGKITWEGDLNAMRADRCFLSNPVSGSIAFVPRETPRVALLDSLFGCVFAGEIAAVPGLNG
jgi:Arc/MetJ family transcription regulator